MAKMLKEERHEQVRQVANEAPEGMQLIKLQVENVMRIKLARIRPQGSVVVVGGKNGHGKSSLLKAIGWLLRGADDMPTDIIRANQNTASIIGQVGPFKITRQFTRVPPEKSTVGNYFYTRIKIEGSRGEEFPSPQILLNQLLGYLSFDPLQFLKKKPAEQCEIVKGMAKFETDIDALDARQKVDYDLRREQGYKVDSLQARFDAMEVPSLTLPAQLIDLDALTKQLEGAANHNSRVAAARTQKLQLEEAAGKWLVEADQLRQTARDLLEQAAAMDGRAAIVKFEPTANLKEYAEKQKRDSAAAIMVGEETDTAAIVAAITGARQVNEAISQRAVYQALEAELLAATEEWTAIDTRMKERKAERERVMQTAELPLPGLTIGDGELWFEGLPLAQASSAQQIRVSLAIGMANNPKVKVLRFMDGGWDQLDEDSQELVRQEIEKRKFQLWVEHVGTAGTVTVVMEDGEASGDDVEVEK